jgi:hypothetical protein
MKPEKKWFYPPNVFVIRTIRIPSQSNCHQATISALPDLLLHALIHAHRLRRADTKGWPLGENLRHEALAFGDAFHFDRDGIHRLLQAIEAAAVEVRRRS